MVVEQFQNNVNMIQNALMVKHVIHRTISYY